jgi:hypothetical protein
MAAAPLGERTVDPTKLFFQAIKMHMSRKHSSLHLVRKVAESTTFQKEAIADRERSLVCWPAAT